MLRVSLLFVSLALFGACTAGEGHPCQEPNDCSGDLVCCKASAAVSERGTCEAECTLQAEDASSDAADDAADATGDAAEAGSDA